MCEVRMALADGGRLVAVVQTVRYKKQDGVLVLTRESLGWSLEGESELSLDVPYSRIKSEPFLGGVTIIMYMCVLLK